MTRVTLYDAAPRPATRARAAVGSREVTAALSLLSASTLLVDLDLDLAVRRGPGTTARLHARHGLRDGVVTAVSTALTDEVEVARFDVAQWQRELARTVLVAPPRRSPAPPARRLELPWDLLVGTGAALARHCPEPYDVLVARAVGSVRADGEVLDPGGCHEQVRRIHHAAVGRLRMVGAAREPDGRRGAGWVSWMMFADGWRALTPYAEAVAGGASRAMVRVEPCRPADLGIAVARWVTASRRP
jgi:hypothetical protein